MSDYLAKDDFPGFKVLGNDSFSEKRECHFCHRDLSNSVRRILLDLPAESAHKRNRKEPETVEICLSCRNGTPVDLKN